MTTYGKGTIVHRGWGGVVLMDILHRPEDSILPRECTFSILKLKADHWIACTTYGVTCTQVIDHAFDNCKLTLGT